MSVLEWQMVKERQKSMIDAWATIHRQLCGNALGELDIVEGRQQRQTALLQPRAVSLVAQGLFFVVGQLCLLLVSITVGSRLLSVDHATRLTRREAATAQIAIESVRKRNTDSSAAQRSDCRYIPSSVL